MILLIRTATMCIDKLVIQFQEPRGGFSRPDNINAGVNPRMISADDVRESLIDAGYRLHEISSGRGQRYYSRIIVMDADGNHLGITIETGNSLYDNDDYLYVRRVTANPSLFSRFRDFWQVIQAMDGPGGVNGLIRRGYIYRIDYACDFRLPLQTIMQGLYVNYNQNLLAYDDFESDNPYAEYRWNQGNFFSFKVNVGKNCIKIYDKGREELKRLRNLRNRYAEQIGEPVVSAESDLEEYDDEYDEVDDEEFDNIQEDEGLPVTGLRSRLNALQQNIADYERSPRTRIERSLVTPAVIRKAWGIRGNERPPLSSLPDHFRRIEAGHFSPFRGVLLSTIDMRGGHLEKRTLEAISIRHDVENGLLMNVMKRMGRRFWRQHRRFFEIYPWHIQNQPTAVFKNRFQAWSSDTGLTTLGAVMTGRLHPAEPETERWPVERSYDTAERMAREGRLPVTGDF